MHHMDTNKIPREKAATQLDATCYLEQILEATPNKKAAVRPPASYHINHSS